MVLPIKERYSYNYDIFRNHFLNSSDRIKKSWQKHTVVLRAQRDGYVTKQDLFDKLEPINSHQGNADFSLIIVIRLLFVADQNEVSASGDMKGLSEDVWSLSDAAAEIQTALSRFHFWPESGKNSQKVGETLRNTIFWSENHLLMTLSSAYLYEQRRLNDPLELQKMRTTHLLLTYLKAHCSPAFGCVGFKSDGSLGGGFYEALAHTYLPYSMSALLNLYDFAEDEEVRVMSAQLLHCIAFQLLLVTVIVPSTDGDLAIASLSGRSISLLFHPQPSNYYTTILYFTASCRSFARTRLRKTDLNINQFINLVLYYANHVSSPDQPVPSAISDFLLTSSWRPDQLLDKAQTNSIYQALEFQGSLQVCVSHPMQLIQDLYEHICSANNYDKAINDLVPFYWSAGLIAHPDYVTHTKKYRKEKGLQNNVHLKMLTSLSFLPSTFLDTYDILSKGQNYSGVNLSLYKAPEVCLTSFKGFNPHIASFQQNPWMANISGAGVWSQTGSEGGKFAGFGMTNTHLPFAQQHNSLLLLSYIAPRHFTHFKYLLFQRFFGHEVRMFWPVHQWDEHGVLCENCRNLHILSLKDSVEGRAATSQQSSIINSQRNFCLCLPKERKEGKWWVARKGNAFIGIHCTQSVKASTAGNPQPVLPIANIKIKADWHVIERCAPPHVAISKDTSKLTAEEEEVLKGQEDVIEEDISDSQVVLEDETEDIEPIEDRFGRILPMQRFKCKSEKHSWIVVVGTRKAPEIVDSNDHSQEGFVSLEHFLRRRCLCLHVSEYREKEGVTNSSWSLSEIASTCSSSTGPDKSGKKIKYSIVVHDQYENVSLSYNYPR